MDRLQYSRRLTRDKTKALARQSERNMVDDSSGILDDLIRTVVVKIFVHKRKPEQSERKWNVQHCTCTWYICK